MIKVNVCHIFASQNTIKKKYSHEIYTYHEISDLYSENWKQGLPFQTNAPSTCNNLVICIWYRWWWMRCRTVILCTMGMKMLYLFPNWPASAVNASMHAICRLWLVSKTLTRGWMIIDEYSVKSRDSVRRSIVSMASLCNNKKLLSSHTWINNIRLEISIFLNALKIPFCLYAWYVPVVSFAILCGSIHTF